MLSRRELFARLAAVPLAAPLVAAALNPSPEPTWPIYENPRGWSPATVSENMARALVKLIAADCLPMVMGHMVMGNLVNRSYEPIVAQPGDTVDVPIPRILASQIPIPWKTGTRNEQLYRHGDIRNRDYEGNLLPPSVGNAQIVLNKWMEASCSMPDAPRALADPEYRWSYMAPASLALAESIDTHLLALRPQFVHHAPVNTISSVGARLRRVPPSFLKYVVVPSSTYVQLRKLPGFYECETWNWPAQYKGLVGQMSGCYIFRTHLAEVRPLRYGGLGFAAQAMRLQFYRLPEILPGTGAISEYAEESDFGARVVLAHNPNSRVQTITIDMLYGVGVLRKAFGVRVVPNLMIESI